MKKTAEKPSAILDALDDVPTPPDVSTLTVVKRRGTIVPFNAERIRNAIEQAFRQVREIEPKTALPEGLANTIERLSQLVVLRALELGQKGIALSVEGIQDLVEVALMRNDYHDIARHYIIYRNQRQTKRPSSALI